jgi:hypothetical protein
MAGDWFYMTEPDQTSDPLYMFHRLVQQYNEVPGFGDCFRHYGAFYNLSDHDDLGNNGQSGGNIITLGFQQAWRRMFPQYRNQFVADHNISWAREIGNGILEIYWDFRNYERTDSDDPLIPFDDPRRRAFGTEFMGWLADLMSGDWRYIIIYSDPVWLSKTDPITGEETELDNKTDCFASYVYTREQIATMMEDCTARGIGGLLVTSDMHSLNCTAGVRNPHGHWNQVGAAGTNHSIVYRGGDYDQYFPPRDSPGDTDLSVWGEIIITDNVGTIAMEFNGWDCLTQPGVPIRQVHLTDVHPVAPQQPIGQDWTGIWCYWRAVNLDNTPALGKLRIWADVDRFYDAGGSGSQGLGIFNTTQVVEIQPAYLPFVDEDGNTVWKWVGAADVFLPPSDDSSIFGEPFNYICEEVLSTGRKVSQFQFTVPSGSPSIDLQAAANAV